MITITNLSKSFQLSRQQKKEMGNAQHGDTVHAVKNISLTCQPGRVFTLLGPNGAGKTTTLRMIATILKPTSGSIVVNGYDTVANGKEVRQNLGFLTTLQRRKKELFDLLGIHEFAHRRVGKFSTGMKQKVSIARTMIHDPQVVVFDEPTSGLDVIAAKSIIELIRQCKRDNKTVILSTHIMSEVNMLADDLAIIYRGDLIYNGLFTDFKQGMREATLEDEFIRMAQEHEPATI